MAADDVDGLAHVVALVVVAHVLDHVVVLVGALHHLLGGELLQPLVLGQRVALRGIGQHGAVAEGHDRAGARGDAEDLRGNCDIEGKTGLGRQNKR